MDKRTTKISNRVKKARSNESGSVFIVVVILAMVMGIMVSSLLKYGTSEMRTNRSHFVYMEASNAAESMVEYGFSELQKRWVRQTSFTKNELRTYPLEIPSTAAEFYGGTKIEYDSLELVGGNVSAGEWKYVDPQVPGNQDDPQKGKRILEREVEVYGKGVALDATFGAKDVYCAQVLSVRDAPLFSHAVFYNMDLEFHPGPDMEMEGPVHSNGDIYLGAASELRFHSTLKSAGHIYHGFKPTGAHLQDGKVLIKNGAGDWVDVYQGGSPSLDSSYVDSRMGEAWRTAATERWAGNVGSVDHEVPQMNPVGIDNYVPDDPNTAADEKFNPAFALIEPQVSTSDPNYKGEAVQAEQLSYKAGLIFKADKVVDATQPGGYDYVLSAYHYQRDSALDPKSAPKMDDDGFPKQRDLKLDQVQAELGTPILSVQLYEEGPDGNPVSGFYDRRQEQGMDVIEMDVGTLAELINTGETAAPGTHPWNGIYHLNPGAAVDWNGLVYVELPYDGSSSARPDKVMPAERNVVLRLVNGGTVPNPDFAKKAGYDPGFTLATNGQLYLQGHFNADGATGTGSSTQTDDGGTLNSNEAVTAFFADSITVLSNAFDDTKSKLDPSERTAVYTEISAALVAGLLPSIPGGTQQSGGAHNLPRFLETWSGREFRYRGSLVALYESEAGIMPMTDGHPAWYSPPDRNWGYNARFDAGIYPPGTPNARDFRRTDFRYLTEEEYVTALSKIDDFDPASSPRGHSAN